MTLEELLDTVDSTDYYEEDAQEYLEDNNIEIRSHSREAIYRQAWAAGWRP